MSLAANTADGDQTVTWLIVGGSPRSGTTALGQALNESRQIALFHEYPTNKFFYAIDRIFEEEKRQELLSGFDAHDHLIPKGSRNGARVVHGIFSAVFPEKSKPPFVGTKTPSYELLPSVDYPQWVNEKTIHITRNPYDVVLSGLRKDYPDCFKAGRALKVAEFRRQLHYWVSAWNHAVLNADNENFLHLFYDDLISAPDLQKELVSNFLDGTDDFDFRSFRHVRKRNTPERFRQVGLEKFLPYLEALGPFENWLQHARRDMESGILYKDPWPTMDKMMHWLLIKLYGLRVRYFVP